MAGHDIHFLGSEHDNSAQSARFEILLTKIEGELNLLKWMVGFNLAITVAILIKILHG